MLHKAKGPSEYFIEELKKAVRVKSREADSEIIELAKAAEMDLMIAGVVSKGEDDPLSHQAIKLYCKANYGYDEKTERFQQAYQSLKNSMALSGEYEGD